MNNENRKPKHSPSSRLRFEDTSTTSGQVGPKSQKRSVSKPGINPDTPAPNSDVPDFFSAIGENAPTSGQMGPKSKPGGKFRQNSQQTRSAERLQHDSEPPPCGNTADADPTHKRRRGMASG